MGTAVEQSTARITSSLLRRKGACPAQIRLFIDLGGDDLEITEALCLAHARRFNWTWAAYRLLREEARETYVAGLRQAKSSYLRRGWRWCLAFWDPYGIVTERHLARARASAFFRAWVSEENQTKEVAA